MEHHTACQNQSQRNNPNTLSPTSTLLGVGRLDRGLESPGSSVFDLPTQPEAVSIRLPPLPPPTISVDQTSHQSDTKATVPPASFIVISGGTGGNAICSAFGDACFVLPVSDDGGSSSEIIRVLGGPSVGTAFNMASARVMAHLHDQGDIRSRLVRLIPRGPPSSPLHAIRNLLAHRLPSNCSAKEAREDWRDIVEGRSALWKGIPNDRKETIRGIQSAIFPLALLTTIFEGFLVYFESELLKRAHKNFDFRNGR